MSKHKYKIGQKVIREGKVWRIRYAYKDVDYPYFITRKNKYDWVSEEALQPLESRKALRKRIAELAEINNKHQNRIMELEKQFATASEAVRIVEALEKMPKGFSISRTMLDIWSLKDEYFTAEGKDKTLSECLNNAGLLPAESEAEGC